MNTLLCDEGADRGRHKRHRLFVKVVSGDVGAGGAHCGCFEREGGDFRVVVGAAAAVGMGDIVVDDDGGHR